MIDHSNPIVQLCIAGMRAESEGRIDAARDLFAPAWAARRDDFDACIAAHCVARNQEALRHAGAVQDDRAGVFYPSLYVNLGWSYETLGDPATARRYYDLAAARIDLLPADAYRDMLRRGIAAGRRRTSGDV